MDVRAWVTERVCRLALVVAIVLPGQLVAQVRLEQATYIGGNDFDRAQGCAIDAAGNIYIAGNSRSTDLPVTPGVVQTSNRGDQDAFVARFSPDLKQLLALTYWGGSGEDRGYGITVDAAGDIYLSGITKSPAFPTSPGAFDRSRAGTVDLFLTKFSPDLKTVRFSTLLGGSSASSQDSDWGRGGIQLDARNNIYLAGRTSGPDFPTTAGAFEETYAGGQHDAFITKIKSDGSALQWSTLVGGATGEESFYGNLVLHSDGSVYAGGYSNSNDFPVTAGVFDSALDGSGYPWYAGEGVVSRFRADGSGLLYSTYLWGPVSANDALEVDARGRAHVVTDVPAAMAGAVPVTSGSAQSGFGGGNFDMGIAILSDDGARVERASFLGGQGAEEGSGIALDDLGNIFIGGNTTSTDFPVTSGRDVVQSAFGGGRDAVFAIMGQDLELLYSTYLGGAGEDRTRCIAYGPNNKVLISGDTEGGFPGVAGGYDASHHGGHDGFIALFSLGEPGNVPSMAAVWQLLLAQ